LNSTDLEVIKQLTPEQVEIYTAIKNMQYKKFVMWVIIVGFFAILATFILEIIGIIKSDWTSKAITGALNGILGGTMYPLVNHFFPALSRAKTTEKKGIN
jgi:hypothetical protein